MNARVETTQENITDGSRKAQYGPMLRTCGLVVITWMLCRYTSTTRASGPREENPAPAMVAHMHPAMPGIQAIYMFPPNRLPPPVADKIERAWIADEIGLAARWNQIFVRLQQLDPKKRASIMKKIAVSHRLPPTLAPEQIQKWFCDKHRLRTLEIMPNPLILQ